jgi:hypothetical protein
MWINMNETNESISGVLAGVMIGAIIFISAAISLRAEYRKLRAAWAKARLENQPGGMEAAPSVAHMPTGPRWRVFIVMSLLVVVWGLMIGFAVGVFSHLFYILFLIPLAMGIGSGWGIADAVKRLKLRTTSYLVFLSLLSAVVIYGSFHYTRYLGFLVGVSIEMSEELPEATGEEKLLVAKAFADYALQEETGHSGFVGYMLYRAQEGVSVGRFYRSSRTNLGPILTSLYWILEFGIILYVTYLMGKGALTGRRMLTGAAVCESCGSRLSGEKHLGGTATANESFLLDLIRQKDFTGMGKLMEKNAEVPSLEVYYQGCGVCGKSPSHLVVRRAFQTAKGSLQFTDAAKTLLQPDESALLLSQLSFSGD